MDASIGAAMLVTGLSLPPVRRRLPERYLGGALKDAGYLVMIPHRPIALFGIGLAMLGTGYVWLHTTLQTRAIELSPEARGIAVALFAFCLFLGGSTGSALFGPLVDHGWHRLFLAICAGTACSAPMPSWFASSAAPRAAGEGCGGLRPAARGGAGPLARRRRGVPLCGVLLQCPPKLV